MYTYTENGRLNLHTAIYVKDGDVAGLEFEFGVVLRNKRYVTAVKLYASETLSFLYPTANSNDMIVVLEMPIPQQAIQRFGQISLYGLVRDEITGGRQSVVDIAHIIDIEGELMQIAPAPKTVQGGNGIVYRPLSGSGQTPSTAIAGQICWQDLTPVGTNGASIIYEVDSANCEDFDSSCSGAGCAGSLGKSLELAAPGALLGG